MNRPCPFSKSALIAFSPIAFLLAMAVPAIVRAQAAPTTDQTPTVAQSNATTPTPTQVNQGTVAAPSESEEVTKLPPFEVQASTKDIGYYTQNTTMGTRLNTSLGDLASPITVISKQQMTDTSSVDINDLFLYEASTEGTENYTATGGFSKGAGVADAIESSPQTSTRIRGLGAPDNTRDFFITNRAISLDTYNVDSVEIDRGPNASLYGIGSPAGIVNESIEQAVLNRDTNEVSARFGSFGDFRSTINLNRSLITDKLSIAVAGLYANQYRTAQEPSYNIQRREFAAITLKPFDNTTVRANIEYYDNPNRRANSLTPADEVTPWLAGGSPKWDPITYTATVNGVVSAPITNLLLLPAGLSGALGNTSSDVPYFYVVHGKVQLWEQQQLGTNFSTESGTPNTPVSLSNPFGPIGYEQSVYTAGNYSKFAGGAPAGQVTYPLFHDPGISNPQLLNWQGLNVVSPNLGEDKAVIYNVEIEQKIADNLFLEAGWYREQFTSVQNNYLGGNVGDQIGIDPNVRFLNGTPNPYFGLPYIEDTQPFDYNYQDLNEQERLALTYQLDFTKNDNWTKWLGHHNLLAFYQHRENDTTTITDSEEVVDAHSWSSTSDIAGAGSADTQGAITDHFYLSNSGAALSFSPGEFTNTNFTYPVTWYNTNLNGGTWTNENAKLAPVINSATRQQQQVWSYSGSLQDYLLNDHLVVTLGQRHDYERNRVSANNTLDPTTGLTDISSLSQMGPWLNDDGITRTAGAVLHITHWLSVHYNQSGNFQPSSLGEDLFGNVLPDPSGHSKDYGFAVSFFDDKLVASLNWYKSNSANSRINTVYVQRAGKVDLSYFVPWAQEVATNNLGASASGTAINNYVANIIKEPNGLQGLINGYSFEADTATIASTGQELNLIYNPTRNWTMKVAADQNESVQSGVYPHVQAFLANRIPVWSAATDPTLGPFWTTVSAGNISGLVGRNQSPQQNLANNVYAAGLDVLLAQQNHIQPDLSRYHFNFITNYQFITGSLTGWGVGTALRYETPAAIGYYGGSPDPAALGAIDTLQAFNPIYGKEVLHQDAWVSYKMRLPFLDKRVRLTVQLNCRDMWSEGDLLTVGVNPDGSANTYRIIPPRQWYLQTTFDF